VCWYEMMSIIAIIDYINMITYCYYYSFFFLNTHHMPV
jgi:hypothetical protein